MRAGSRAAAAAARVEDVLLLLSSDQAELEVLTEGRNGRRVRLRSAGDRLTDLTSCSLRLLGPADQLGGRRRGAGTGPSKRFGRA